MSATLTIPKLKFSEPRHNLPGRKGIATQEDRFTISFARSYASKVTSLHYLSRETEMVLAREIPVNGYGIADLLAVAWEPSLVRQPTVEAMLATGLVTTRAFECKMSNWRAALSQGVHYRFFAYQSIVVLPPAACLIALKCIETFRKTKTGLWEYDVASGRICVHHTPPPEQPKSHKYLVHSVGLVNRATKRALPIL